MDDNNLNVWVIDVGEIATCDAVSESFMLQKWHNYRLM